MTLFEQGLGRSSYQARETKLWEILNMAFEHPSGFFIGWGKSYFGILSRAMDNEHLYIFTVYGPIIYVIMIGYLVKLFFNAFNETDRYKQTFIILMLLGVPLAWPNTYYTVPKIMMILLIYYVNFARRDDEVTSFG
jgi:hypothetical protein